MQFRPPVHGAPLPQRHWPAVEQVSAVEPQLEQVAPGPPHCWAVMVVQAPAAQQPPGHEIASQTHPPVKQRWPVSQAGLTPHRQVPLEQVLAVVPQATQAPPEVLQAPTDGVTQLPATEQQPVGQDVESQTH